MEVAPILNTPDCLSSLGLDTQVTHLIHVKEKWEIQVEIDYSDELIPIKKTFYSSDKVEIIQKLVQDETHLDHIKLYHEKQYLHNNSYLGNVCLEGPCKLFATHDGDKYRKDIYFNQQREDATDVFLEDEGIFPPWIEF